jgi:transposase
LPLLDTGLAVLARIAQLSMQLIASGQTNEQCQLLMSIPGIGALTASPFIAATEDRANFAKSWTVGAGLGLTTRRY